MDMAATWLRLDLRRRWRSLVVLALLVALTTGTVLAAAAGARRGQTAFDRLWARSLPATVSVLANQPGFDWSKVEALPEVSASALFVVYYGALVTPAGTAAGGGTDLEFPPGNAGMLETVERPVILQGRMYVSSRADEVVATPHYLSAHHLRVGALLTVRLSSPAQAAAGFDASTGKPLGPVATVRIVGVARSPFWLDQPGDSGGVLPTYAFFQQYRQYVLGNDPKNTASFSNALLRLKGGEAQIPAFKADLTRVTGRSDIDVMDNAQWLGDPIRKATGYEAVCLLAFAVAALLAALFLVGQTVARYAAGAADDLRVLQAVGLTRRQAAVAAALAPGLAAAVGAAAGVAAALVASLWMPIGIASLAEPDPGFNADWLVLGPGWAVAVLLVAGATALITWSALNRRRAGASSRGSLVASAAAGAGLPVAAVVGARFAFEPGRGRSAVPVFPAIAGAVAGVLGVLAVFTFSAGIADAAANPARFGITWQLDTYYGYNGQDFGPSAQVSRAVAASPDVSGFLDVRVGGAQSKGVSVESFTYAPVAGKSVPVTLTAGRMPGSPDEITLGPTTAHRLQAGVGSVIRLSGGPASRGMTVSGIAFVPAGPHNDDDQGAWLTPGGYDRLFRGAAYAYKFHVALVALRPGTDPGRAARTLTAAAARIKGGAAFPFTLWGPAAPVTTLEDLAVLPKVLGGFLGLLAVAAVGYALVTAVRRRGRELAVLRALGLTSREARRVIVTQATLLAVVGLAAGIPLGLVVGRGVWRVVANFTPLAYQPPLSRWALVLIVPAALLCANLLALWPGWRAARLRPGQVLRAE
ncbi:MAG TPA: FtsX-like permease family protein [Trebonia sp.]